ncbi:MAG TPA: MarR family transcriptional regulator [Trueperaceae bacterium]
MPDLDAQTRQLLTLLYQAEGATTTELTRLLGRRHTQSTSASLRNLERRGLVAKEGRKWTVTEAGRALLDPLVKYVPAASRESIASNRALLDALTDEPLTTAQLADLAGVERSNAHKRLAALADRGLAERVDGRPVRWRRALTVPGRSGTV